MDLRQSLIPTVLDETARGDRAYDIFSLLLRERIVFLGQEVDDTIANLVIAQILHLEARDPDREIQLYINSPGGLAYAGMAIYDVMQHVRPPVSTICVGMGMSAAAMVLCAGAPGLRMAQIIAFHSGQPIEKVRQDLDRDYFMDAATARDYGIVDEVLGPRRGISQELLSS